MMIVHLLMFLAETKSFQMKKSLSNKRESTAGHQYSLIQAAIIVERKPSYFIDNVLLPSFLVTTLAAVSFLLPVSEVADRLSVLAARLDRMTGRRG